MKKETQDEEWADDDMTLAEHAEAWWMKQERKVPPPETPEYEEMYQKWVHFAFSALGPFKSLEPFS